MKRIAVFTLSVILCFPVYAQAPNDLGPGTYKVQACPPPPVCTPAVDSVEYRDCITELGKAMTQSQTLGEALVAETERRCLRSSDLRSALMEIPHGMDRSGAFTVGVDVVAPESPRIALTKAPMSRGAKIGASIAGGLALVAATWVVAKSGGDGHRHHHHKKQKKGCSIGCGPDHDVLPLAFAATQSP